MVNWFWSEGNQFHGCETEIQRLFEPSFDNTLLVFKNLLGTSLVTQWRIHLPVQGWQVGSLVQVDPTWLGAVNPEHHKYWSCGLNPGSWEYWDCNPHLWKPTTPRGRGPQQEKPPQGEACALQLESGPCSLLVERARTATKAQDHQKQAN